jgi:hypothetical protein
VLQRHPDDTRRIVSRMYMEASQERSYVGHC